VPLVDFRRQRIEGPELFLEDSVAASIGDLFGATDPARWRVLGSAQVGAGNPDLTVVRYRANVTRFPGVHPLEHYVLGYLRLTTGARAATVARRLGLDVSIAEDILSRLHTQSVLLKSQGVYALRPTWRTILQDVIAIEAKVRDWRRAARQAIRNLVFAYESYIAVPSEVGARIEGADIFARFGLGLLAVGREGEVTILRRAHRQPPKVWSYYYYLAREVARNPEAPADAALHHAARKGGS
jgi:hypothetical protein